MSEAVKLQEIFWQMLLQIKLGSCACEEIKKKDEGWQTFGLHGS
jgi:hypothetical protein